MTPHNEAKKEDITIEDENEMKNLLKDFNAWRSIKS